jgi:hypothetical protein
LRTRAAEAIRLAALTGCASVLHKKTISTVNKALIVDLQNNQNQYS